MNGDLTTSPILLSVWAAVLVLASLAAIATSIWSGPLERLRKFLPALLVSPGVLLAILVMAQSFEPIERPLVHWVFEKTILESLRLGIGFDVVGAAVTIFFGLAVMVIGFRNRPSAPVSAALSVSWIGLSLVATSTTLWMAFLGMGIQLFSRFLPILSSEGNHQVEDSRWATPMKRSWISLSVLLCGASGLAAGGVSLDFGTDSAWKELSDSTNTLSASGLLVAGLLLLTSPFFSSHAIYASSSESFEEGQFVSETAISWGAILVIYRLFGGLGETPWTLGIAIAALVTLFLSVFATVYQMDHKNASRMWLSSVPLYCLTILPLLPAHEARLFILGAILSFVGIWICLVHRRTPAEVVCAAIFFGGIFGLAGWSTSAGIGYLYSGIENEPIYRGTLILVSILFGAAGWRLVLRGNGEARPQHLAGKFTLVGVIILVGFGPVLSGRWSGGGVPFELDWLSGATEWSWVRALPGSIAESNWIGFAIAQATLVLAMILGTWASASTPLFPFPESNPAGARALAGLLGLVWIRSWFSPLLYRLANTWSDQISLPLWEKLLPAVNGRVLRGLRKLGEWSERATDPLTSGVYAELFRSPAKLVQWLHGGNVRLYAWFALIWILIFSVYLTR